MFVGSRQCELQLQETFLCQKNRIQPAKNDQNNSTATGPYCFVRKTISPLTDVSYSKVCQIIKSYENGTLRSTVKKDYDSSLRFTLKEKHSNLIKEYIEQYFTSIAGKKPAQLEAQILTFIN